MHESPFFSCTYLGYHQLGHTKSPPLHQDFPPHKKGVKNMGTFSPSHHPSGETNQNFSLGDLSSSSAAIRVKIYCGKNVGKRKRERDVDS